MKPTVKRFHLVLCCPGRFSVELLLMNSCSHVKLYFCTVQGAMKCRVSVNDVTIQESLASTNLFHRSCLESHGA